MQSSSSNQIHKPRLVEEKRNGMTIGSRRGKYIYVIIMS